jgi:hypothetical protein
VDVTLQLKAANRSSIFMAPEAISKNQFREEILSTATLIKD